MGLAWDDSTGLLHVGVSNDRIKSINPDTGQLISELAWPVSGIWDITLDDQGNFWGTGSCDVIVKLSPQSGESQIFPAPDPEGDGVSPAGIVWDDANTLWVVDRAAEKGSTTSIPATVR